MSSIYGLIVVGVLLVGGLAAALGGCSFRGGYIPGNNINEVVYGPPEMFGEPGFEDPEYPEPEDDPWEDESSSGGDSVDVPVDPDEYDEDEDLLEEDVEDYDDFEASGNLVQLIYGPPEMMDD